MPHNMIASSYNNAKTLWFSWFFKKLVETQEVIHGDTLSYNFFFFWWTFFFFFLEILFIFGSIKNSISVIAAEYFDREFTASLLEMAVM